MAYHRRQVFCYEGSFVHPTNFSLASVVENLQQNELPSCYLEAEANGNNLQRVVFVDQRFPVKEMIVCNGKGGASSEVSQIGYWSEIKLDIVREYAAAYSKILAAQHRPRLSHVYIDAFAGAGYHITKAHGDLVWGSPLNALLINPPFDEYHFIDLDKGNVDTTATICYCLRSFQKCDTRITSVRFVFLILMDYTCGGRFLPKQEKCARLRYLLTSQ
jgi:hypothetical protein